jgi:NTE family protein
MKNLVNLFKFFLCYNIMEKATSKEKKESERKKIGLALGAGGTLGYTHVGVLKVLEKHKIPIDYIAGSSIGSLMGAHYALYKSADKTEKAALDFVKDEGLRIYDLSTVTSRKTKEKKIKLYLEELFGSYGVENTKIPFISVTVDLGSGEEFLVDRGRLVDAVMGSITAGVFTPVFFWGRWLVDGGFLNPTPLNVARDMGADFVIGVDLTKRIHKSINETPGWWFSLNKSMDITIRKLDELRSNEVRNKIVVFPDFKDTNEAATVKKAKEFIEAGETATERLIPKIKKMMKE